MNFNTYRSFNEHLNVQYSTFSYDNTTIFGAAGFSFNYVYSRINFFNHKYGYIFKRFYCLTCLRVLEISLKHIFLCHVLIIF